MMYSKKKKGFSLAELLISLLIISIVLAAAIPTITKRNAAGSEKIWHWSEHNNSVYSAVGSNQSVIIGAESSPFKDREDSGTYFSSFFQDAGVFSNPNSFDNYFTTDGDKLVLFKKSLTADNGQSISNMANSHISFYTLRYTPSATTGDVHYAGRLAADKYNLALGIASLQSFNTTEAGTTTEGTIGGYNTALGHHTLTYNQTGLYNTAVGEKAIARNTIGSENTAVGYSSLMKLTANGGNAIDYSNNTALGSFSLTDFVKGYGNTAIGANSQFGTTEGSYNTAIGVDACSYIKGDYNVCLGYGAGASPKAPKINPGTDFERWTETEKDYSLNIGVARAVTPSNSVYGKEDDTPLISGIMQAYTDSSGTVDKYLGVNTRIFSVNTFNGTKPIFYARSKMGSNNYDKTKATIGDFFFNLRDTGNPETNTTTDKTSLLLSMSGISGSAGTDKKVVLNAYDTYHPDDLNSYADFSINNKFLLEFDETNAIVGLNTKHNYTQSGTSKVGYGTLRLNDFVDVVSVGDGTSTTPTNQQFKIKAKQSKTIDSYTYPEAVFYDRESDTMTMAFAKAYLATSGEAQAHVAGDLTLTTAGEVQIMSRTAGKSITTNMPIQFAQGDGSFGTGFTRIDFSDVAVSKGTKRASLWDVATQLNQHIAETSDIRLKNVSGPSKAGLKEINALEVVNYTYKKDEKKEPHVGVIAQQLQKIFPNSVIKDDEGFLRIKKEEIFYAMVNSIKELFAKIQDLTAKVTGLDKRITELEQQNKLLKEQNEAFEKRLAKLEKQAAK